MYCKQNYPDFDSKAIRVVLAQPYKLSYPPSSFVLKGHQFFPHLDIGNPTLLPMRTERYLAKCHANLLQFDVMVIHVMQRK